MFFILRTEQLILEIQILIFLLKLFTKFVIYFDYSKMSLLLN